MQTEKSEELKYSLEVCTQETTVGDKKYDYCRLELMAQRHLELKMKDSHLGARNRDGCARLGSSMGSKLSMQKPNQLRRRREVFDNSYTQKKIPDPLKRDNSMEFTKAREVLDRNHERSTRHRSEAIGIAERAVRRVKESTSSVLVQSDLQESQCAEAMGCYCYLRNAQDLLA